MSEQTFEYRNERLVDELWFSSGKFLGEGPAILITENRLTGQRICRIGVVLGLDPDHDRKKIIDQGAKLNIQQVERILVALKGDA